MMKRSKVGYAAFIAIVMSFLIAALIVGEKPVLSYFDLTNAGMILATWSLPPLLWLIWIGIKVTIRRVNRPTAVLFRTIWIRRYWLLRGAALMSLTFPAVNAFSTIKQAIPKIVPYYADPAFIAADRMIFFGIDPWRITHALFGPLSTLIIDRLYLLWFPMMLGLNAWLNFTRDRTLQQRGLLTYLLTWILLGNVAAIAFSSVGPCFYEYFYHDTHFRPLMDTLRAYDQVYGIKAFGAMNWLYEERDVNRFASGISAMPSMHVAIAFLMFVVVRHTRQPRWGVWLAGTYAGVIWVGSVHLGWHYAIDGLASIIGVSIIWWAMGKFVDWVEREPLDERSQPALLGPVVTGAT